MVENSLSVGFADTWIWLIFVIIGLVMVLLELLIGVDTGLDLVFLGSAFILGGFATWLFFSWVLTLLVTAAICLIYLFLGRRFIHRMTLVKKSKTNIDAIIGKTGVVLKSISPTSDGLVRVGNEEWRARALEDIREGEQIIVQEIRGVTLIVKKSKGGE